MSLHYEIFPEVIEDLESAHISEEMDGREDEEVRNVGSERESVSSGCETSWES
jgi:hypothetical protein